MTVFMSKGEKNLQKLTDTVQKQCEDFEMQVNVQRNAVMVVSKD